MIKKTKMKKGITLIEIILAIVLIAIILGITIPKLMANSARAEIKQVISSDVKSIVEAAILWRKSTTSAAGSYSGINNRSIFSRLPTTMLVETGYIMSSGLNTGNGVAGTNTGARYGITWSLKEGVAGTSRLAFSIAIDVTNGVELLKWDQKLSLYALEVFNDTVQAATTEATLNDSNADGTYVYQTDSEFASGFGGADLIFNCTDANAVACSDLVRVSQ